MQDYSNTKIFYNLQCCRGIAAVMVLMAHANLMVDKQMFSGAFIIGWSGVDFFFILSGFIIYYINFKYAGKRNELKKYLSKRLIRVYPIYWLYTTAFLILNYLLIKFAGKGIINWISLDFMGILRSYLLYPTNIVKSEMPIIPVAWTLSFEIIFYIIFGVYILSNKKIFQLIVGIWMLFVALNFFKVIDVTQSPLLSTLCNAKNIEFIYGCVIAHLSLKNKISRNRSIGISVLLVGMILLAISWINEMNQCRYFPKMDSLNFGIPYSLIIYGLISLETYNPNNKIKNSLVFLGDASYSIYLMHYISIVILYVIFKRIMHNHYGVFVIITTVLTAAGCICYSWIEMPLLKTIRRYSKKQNTPVIVH
ncbi:acyltransferase [Mucilaginibacter rubeus]|uniref:Acyltransferase n=2 Tax=Mucilaginibacter rubeus TaxID=2027860 RepID=A0A5C1HVR7_9SPHI|nr:acyltransferase [Mucilaginibacter rubeus]